jgi:fucose permease
MLVAIGAAGLIWIDVQPLLSFFGLALMGLVLAPVFPSLMATTPARLGQRHAANGVGLEIAAAVLGGAGVPAGVGVLAARGGLELVGPCLAILCVVLFALHEALIRRVFEPPENARSRTGAVASSQPGA